MVLPFLRVVVPDRRFMGMSFSTLMFGSVFLGIAAALILAIAALIVPQW